MRDLTTQEIEWLIQAVHKARRAVLRHYSRRQREDWIEEFADMTAQLVQLLHDYRHPRRRKYIDYPTVMRRLEEVLCTVAEQHPEYRKVAENHWRVVEGESHTLKRYIAQLETEVTATRAECERLRLQAAIRPAAATVEMPAAQVTVQSEVQQTILGIMAQTGLSRSWRIIEQVLELGVSTHRGSVQNALKALTDDGLLADFEWQGQRPGWQPGAGRARRLVVLTERGKAWTQAAYGKTPVAAELNTEFVRRHDSVAHAVGILEAATHLQAAGWRVEMDPAPLLAGDQRWGRRSEPDLLLHIDSVRWPVEVQREVNPRRNEQWAKILKIEGRLALILFSNAHCDRQVGILREAQRKQQLPAGEIRLASLEVMESSAWSWRSL